MPTPSYLIRNSENILEKREYTNFDLICNCGSKDFFLMKNVMTKEEKAELKPYHDFLSLWCCSDLPKEYKEDEKGETHYFMQSDYPESSEWKEILCPPCPVFFLVNVVKAECSCCGREILLFDSRYHGYDAKYCNVLTDEDKAYIPTIKKIRRVGNKTTGIKLKIKNIVDYKYFLEHYDAEASEEDYADAFAQMCIYSVGESGRKRMEFDFKTV